MRIAMFASLLGVEATGQSAVVAGTATRLMEAGQEVTILGTDCGLWGAKVTKFVKMPDNIPMHVFPSVGKLNRRLYRSTALTQWLKKHIDEFDVLDVQGVWSFAGMDAARIFAANHKPYVLTPHGTMTKYDWQKSMKKRKLLFAMGLGKVWREADAIRFSSTGELKTSYYPATGRAAIIPNSIELQPAPNAEQRAAARARLNIAPDTQMMLFIGRLAHQKGVKEIIAGFEIAAQQLPKLKLYLVGPPEAEYGQEVLALVKASPLADRIVATGPVFGDAKYDYLRSADVFITLSHNEGMSIAHLEAMAEGLPMILTENSNMDYLEEYGAGILATHDPKQSSQVMVKMFSDPVALAETSRNARKLVEEKYVTGVVTPQLATLYEQLMASKKGSKS